MITACLITKNEERWIKTCLDSLRPLVDEIIIADTGSTDKTLSILDQLQSNYFQITWQDDFSWARNQTIDRAKEPWIFSFDADEALSAKDIHIFKELIQKVDQDPEIEAVSLVRRNYIVNAAVSGFIPCRSEYPEEMNFPGYYEERMVRIFRNRPHIRWRGKLHEMVDPSLKGKIFQSQLVFHHYGYTPMEEKSRQKSRLYQEYGERKVKENPSDWKAHLDLGSEYLQAGKLDESIQTFYQARALKGKEPRILANLGYALMERGRFDESRNILDECLQADPHHHDGLLNLGVSLMRQKKFSQAVTVLQGLLVHHPESFMAYKNIGLCFMHLRNFSKGIESFQKSLQIFPTFVETEIDLAVAYLMSNQTQTALQLLKSISSKHPNNERARSMIDHLEKNHPKQAG